MKILVINAGSSSLKYQLIDMETEQVMAKGLRWSAASLSSMKIFRFRPIPKQSPRSSTSSPAPSTVLSLP